MASPVLDGRSGGGSAVGIAAYGQAGRKADKRAMALSRIFAVMVKRIVQVAIHVPVGSMGDIAVNQLPDRIGIGF